MIQSLPISSVAANPDQPRKHFDEAALLELSESIKAHGLLQPIVVREVGDQFVIVAGERRYRAHLLAGLESIDVIVKQVDEEAAFILSIAENVNREDMNPMEEAHAYSGLLRTRSKEQIADLFGKTRVHVEYRLALLRLDETIQHAVARGTIGIAFGWHLARLSPNGQMEVLRRFNHGEFKTEAAAAEYVSVIALRESEVPMFDLGAAEEKAAETRTRLSKHVRVAATATQAIDAILDISQEALAGLGDHELEVLVNALNAVSKTARTVATHVGQARRLAEAAKGAA